MTIDSSNFTLSIPTATIFGFCAILLMAWSLGIRRPEPWQRLQFLITAGWWIWINAAHREKAA